MKKILLLLLLNIFLPPSVKSQNTVVPYEKPLPKISKTGKMTLPNGKKLKIKGFNDPKATVFFIVRHSEKESSDSNADLNAIGRGRAATFPIILKDIALNGVYSTDRPRTRNTAQPIAAAKGLTTEIYDAKQQADLLKKLAEQHGKRFFIVGHSNTVPQIVNILRGDDSEKEFSESDYSRLYIVVAEEIGKVRMWLVNF
jgi:phosphohistidine phosphatase SixA